MLLTVFAAKKFEPDDRDDIALYKVLDGICRSLYWWGFTLTKPVEPENNLFEFLSSKQKDNFKDKVTKFRDAAYKAIHEDSKVEASKIWQKQFGNRFPINT